MYLADYHMHSRLSPDAGTSMADMAEAAVAAGLNEICFTDHVEPVMWVRNEKGAYIHSALTDEYDWSAMTAEFAEAQRAIGDRLTMRLGAEVGDAYMHFPSSEKQMAGAPELDFLIGSAHTIVWKGEGLDLYMFYPESEDEAYAGIEDYLQQVSRLVEWGKFDVLGHLTLPLRYLHQRGFSVSYDRYEDQVEQILRKLVETGRGIELNTNRGGMPLPGEKWLRMYRRLGGEIITLGSDAHSTNFVGCAIRERQELLKSCGFTRFCTFRRREPIWHALP